MMLLKPERRNSASLIGCERLKMVRRGESRKYKEWWKVVSASEGKVSSSSNYLQHVLRWFLPLAVFCWPILYLFRHIFPINGQYTAVGQDFLVLYYKYKVYLLACLADFHFPLWSPAEGTGFRFTSTHSHRSFIHSIYHWWFGTKFREATILLTIMSLRFLAFRFLPWGFLGGCGCLIVTSEQLFSPLLLCRLVSR